MESTERPRHVPGPAVRRWPRRGAREFRRDETFVVPDGHAAVFVAGGSAADGLASGEHLLTSSTVPRLFAQSEASPMEASVHFFPTGWHELRWGTRYPVAFRDNMFGVLRLRAFGTYEVRFDNPPLFVNSVVVPGENGESFEFESLIRDLIASRLADFLSDRVDTLMDLTRYIDSAPTEVGVRLVEDFERRGLSLRRFAIHGVTVPDDVMQTLEARSGIGAVSGVVSFLRNQNVAAVRDDSGPVADPATFGDPSDDTSDDVAPGLFETSSWGARDADPADLVDCPRCQNSVPGGSHACSFCAHEFYVHHRCPSCTAKNPAGWRFCVECGGKNSFSWTCPSCETDIPVGSRFCMACGNVTEGD